MLIRRSFIHMLITRFVCPCLLLVCCLAGCSGERSVDGRTSVTFWHSFVSSTIPALNDLIADFEAEHPDIRIRAQYVPTGDALVQKLIAAVQSRTAPDIAWIHADFLDKLARADAIYPMGRFLTGPNGLPDGAIEDIFPELLVGASWRDTLYALPMEATLLALLYNKDLFREAGLDPEQPPGTWEELREYAKRLMLDRNGNGRFDQHGFYVPTFPASGELSIWMVLQWLPYLWQAGGVEIDEAQQEVSFNSAAGVEALAFWKTLYDELDALNFSLSHDLGFASGRLAMVMDGPWNLPRYRETIRFDWGVVPLPAGPAGRATYLAGEHLAIFQQSHNPDAAWKFIKYVIQPEVQAKFSIASGYLPVRKSTLELEPYQQYLKGDPHLQGFVDQLPYARARRPIDFGHVEINRYLAEAIEQTLRAGADPKTTLDNAARRSNEVLSRSTR